MTLHAIFTEDGIPGWIGREPHKGSEELPDEVLIEGAPIPVTITVLAGHRRLPDGTWVPRDPPPPPTEDDLAREAEIAAQAETEVRLQANRALEDEVARRAQPDALLRSMGMITIADLKARVAAIRAEVEAGR
jgi:hypothetical protein